VKRSKRRRGEQREEARGRRESESRTHFPESRPAEPEPPGQRNRERPIRRSFGSERRPGGMPNGGSNLEEAFRGKRYEAFGPRVGTRNGNRGPAARRRLRDSRRTLRSREAEEGTPTGKPKSGASRAEATRREPTGVAIVRANPEEPTGAERPRPEPRGRAHIIGDEDGFAQARSGRPSPAGLSDLDSGGRRQRRPPFRFRHPFRSSPFRLRRRRCSHVVPAKAGTPVGEERRRPRPALAAPSRTAISAPSPAGAPAFAGATGEGLPAGVHLKALPRLHSASAFLSHCGARDLVAGLH
jgi:hypothetical protein